MAKGTESLMYFVTAGFRNDYAELLFFHEKPNRNRNHGFYTLENRNRSENLKSEQFYLFFCFSKPFVTLELFGFQILKSVSVSVF